MKSPADHPDFTAMAIGEHIDGTPPQAVLDALHQNPAARREADAIRSTAQRLSSALGSSGSHSLDSAARLAILNADPAAVRARFATESSTQPASSPATTRPRPRHDRYSWVVPTAAAAAVVIAGWFFLNNTRIRQRSGNPSAQDENPEPTGFVRATPPDKSSPPQRRNIPRHTPGAVTTEIVADPAIPAPGSSSQLPVMPAPAVANEDPARSPMPQLPKSATPPANPSSLFAAPERNP
jgi:hypothetical protein